MQTQDGREKDAVPTTYNFHDLFTVRVAHRDLNAMMRRELSIFIEDVDPVDLRVEEGDVPIPDRSLVGGYAFDESTFVVETPSGRVQLGDGLIRAGSVHPYELLRWVTNAMRRRLLQREVAVLHAVAVARDGQALVFPAWSRTGKTNLQLTLLANGYEYMADDWCPVSASGEVFAYPRHLNLYEYNFDCNPGLINALGNGREGRVVRHQLAVTKFARSLDGTARLTGILRRLLLDHFFVSARVPVSQLIRGCGTTMRAPLAGVCLLDKRPGESTLSEVSPTFLARKVALMNRFERFPFTSAQTAMEYAGLQRTVEETVSREEDLLTRVFSRTKCMEVTVPPHATRDELDRVRRMLEDA